MVQKDYFTNGIYVLLGCMVPDTLGCTQKETNLRFLKSQNVRITNLQTGEIRIVEIGRNGEIKFESMEPASYQLLRYDVL